MLIRIAVTAVTMFSLAIATAKSDASVIARGKAVSSRPVTVVAVATAYKPSRVMLDVVPRSSARVRVEWIVLCSDGPGPTTGGDLVIEGPVHRRVKLPPRPRGLCHLEAEASFIDPSQTGQIAVTLRGRVKKLPNSMR